MFKTLKNVSSNCSHVFVCVADKIFCLSSLKDSELKFLYSLCKILQGLFFFQMMLLIQLELIYESQIDHCILQWYFENMYFWLLERDQWMLL